MNNINKALVLILTIMLFILGARHSAAQKVAISLTAEKTVLGVMKGTTISLINKKAWSIGVFHETNEILGNEKHTTEKTRYSGLTTQIPLKKCGDIALLFHLNTGIINKKYFIITPKIETRIRLTQHLELGLDMGYRMSQATIGSKLIFKI